MRIGAGFTRFHRPDRALLAELYRTAHSAITAWLHLRTGQPDADAAEPVFWRARGEQAFPVEDFVQADTAESL